MTLISFSMVIGSYRLLSANALVSSLIVDLQYKLKDRTWTVNLMAWIF